ncbi:MAG: ribonuclease P protein component [Acidobacteriota bacterium]
MRASGERLGCSERLRRKAEFQSVYGNGRRILGRYFIGYVLGRQNGALRLGVVAGRRVGGAVARNRAKRLLREVFRKNKPPNPVSADVVLIARAAIREARYREVEDAYVRSVYPALEKSGSRR